MVAQQQEHTKGNKAKINTFLKYLLFIVLVEIDSFTHWSVVLLLSNVIHRRSMFYQHNSHKYSNTSVTEYLNTFSIEAQLQLGVQFVISKQEYCDSSRLQRYSCNSLIIQLHFRFKQFRMIVFGCTRGEIYFLLLCWVQLSGRGLDLYITLNKLPTPPTTLSGTRHQ